MLIGLSGKRGVGKTTAAKYLEKCYDFERVSFAEELKKMARSMFPFTEADMTDPKKKESKFGKYDWSPREFMIHLGEFMRFHDEKYWLDRALDRLKSKGRYVVDDVRYPNEYDEIKKRGGIVIRIDRYEDKNPYGKNLDTPSETSLDKHKFDFTINECRNMSIKELCEQMDVVMETVTSK